MKNLFSSTERSSETPPLRWGKIKNSKLSYFPSVAAKHHPCGGVKFKIIADAQKITEL
jgi:hypothetical protein